VTCVVGIVDDERVWVGADSAAVAGLGVTVRRDPKVFELRNEQAGTGVLVGFTSSFRMGQLLRYKMRLPGRYPGEDAYEWMVKEFVEAARACLKEGGFTEVEKARERGGTFIVGVPGSVGTAEGPGGEEAARLFAVHDDFQVAEPVARYYAVGCGDELALGSLATSGDWDSDPYGRVVSALRAAEMHSAGVSGPFTVLTLPHPVDLSPQGNRVIANPVAGE
jgi:hypothetical protein